MKGSINPVGKCPKCLAKFQLSDIRVGYKCVNCLTRPRHYFIRIYIPLIGKKRIFLNRSRQSLVDWRMTVSALYGINREIETGTFDLRRYRPERRKDLLFSAFGDDCEATYAKDVERGAAARVGFDAWRSRYRTHVRPYFASELITEVGSPRIGEFLRHVANKVTNSSKTYGHIRGVLHDVLKHAVQKGAIERAPEFPRQRLTRRSPEKKVWLTAPEQVVVVSRFDPWDQPIITALTQTGMRPGEPRRLPDDAFLDGEQSKIDIAITKANPRTIDVDPDVASAIRRHRLMKQSTLQDKKVPNTLFVTKRGRAYTEFLLEQLWNKAQDEAMRDGALPPEKRCTLNQGARHSFISQKILEGRSLEWIAKYAGTSVAMIRKHYDHLIGIPLPGAWGRKRAVAE